MRGNALAAGWPERERFAKPKKLAAFPGLRLKLLQPRPPDAIQCARRRMTGWKPILREESYAEGVRNLMQSEGCDGRDFHR
jgi:hypothetical protein